MNTGKQINAMVLILFLTLIAVGAYTIWDPFRSDRAVSSQDEKTADFGAQTFALNCRLCHGDRGQGGPAGGRLAAAPALDRAALQGIDKGAFSQTLFNTNLKMVTNTITCGRAGTDMPTWGASQGGTLNDEQIRQLVTLITEGRWQLAQVHADEIDAVATGNATVQLGSGSLGVSDTELVVSNAGPFTLGQYIRIADERLRVLPKQVAVERGVDGTTAADHTRGTLLLKDGAPILRNQAPVLRNGNIVLLGGTKESLVEPAAAGSTALVVGDTSGFAVGDTLKLDDELVRVTGVSQGIPTTGDMLITAIGRTPKHLLVSGTAGLAAGATVRMGNELLLVTAVHDAGDAGLNLTAALSADGTQIGVNNPSFLRQGYQVRLGDEQVIVNGPVDTGQTLGETIGRAETTFAVTGTDGLEQGMVLRIDDEQMRVTQIVQPTQIVLDRHVDGTAAAAHATGTDVLKVVAAPAAGLPPEDPATGQKLVAELSPGATSAAVSGSAKLSVGQKFHLGDEVVQITAIQPAQITVQRAVAGTERAAHARRAAIYDGDRLYVQRGVDGTSAVAHNAGDKVLLAQMDVKRSVNSSILEEHGKNTEIFLGNRLILDRGVLGTAPAAHKDGQLVRNFPIAPDNPAITGDTCGQRGGSTASGPTPTPVAGAKEVDVALKEYKVTPSVTSISAGAVSFKVTNTGTAPHNFRVIKTNLDPAVLPVSNDQVDETQLNVVARSAGNSIAIGVSDTVPVPLDPGTYVLICNVPTHYGNGMHVRFEVTQ